MTLIDFSAMCKHALRGNKNSFYLRIEINNVEASFAHASLPPARINNFYASTESTVTDIDWRQLENVSYQLKYNKEYDMRIHYPVFGEDVKKLSGKTVKISGYMIPFDIEGGLYAVSRNTYAACFFCGAAGVESVISIKFKNRPTRYKTDQYCTIEGRLELNDTNVDDFIYILHDAEDVTD